MLIYLCLPSSKSREYSQGERKMKPILLRILEVSNFYFEKLEKEVWSLEMIRMTIILKLGI